MRCAHLSLRNFRNYSRLELDLRPGVTILIGDNAQGKSNLLESIYFLSTTRSFRASSERELINWRVLGSDVAFARLIVQVDRGGSHPRIEATINEELRLDSEGVSPTAGFTKRFRLNDLTKRGIEILGTVNSVMFSPQDIDLVIGAPSVRRRYLDVTISQVEPRYVRGLSHYNRVLLQRNQLLRQIREGKARAGQLPIWDQQLVGSGAPIVKWRADAIRRINEIAQEIHRELTGRQERLRIAYRSSVSLGDPDTKEIELKALEVSFAEQIRVARPKETGSGMSVVGPHRDDLGFLVDERDMGSFGSRGQQRTVALALKLAEAEFLHQSVHDRPVLLLDDVLSELDESRRHHLLDFVRDYEQVIFSATDLGSFERDFLEGATILRVEEGAISRVEADEFDKP